MTRAEIRRLAVPVLACAALTGLGGCESFSQAFGLKRNAPDEFAVVTQAPLVIPPDFQLRPPVPGAPRPQQLTPQGDAQRALFEANIQPGASGSTEKQILAKAGAERANPEIKALVSKETTAVVPKEPGFVDQLMFWKDNAPPPEPQTTVVAPDEARRLKEAQILSAPATQGKTPVAKDESPGFFGRVLDWIF